MLVAAAGLALGGTIAQAQPMDPADRPVPREPTAPARPAPTPAADRAMQRFEDRPIRVVKINGLVKTNAQLVRNQVRSREGAPLSPQTVREDVQRLTRLGRFKQIDARVESFADGSVTLIFDTQETPIIADVQAVGNRQIPDSEIAPAINLLKDTAVDEFQLGAARSAIEKLYRDKGYYQATVSIDQAELDKNGIVLFQISEGEQVKVTEIRFAGNKVFEGGLLLGQVKTKTSGLFEDGPVDNEQLDRDVEAVAEFYRDRGYLDIRADRRVIFAPNGKEAIVEFIVDEGPLYTLRSVQVQIIGAAAEEAAKGAADEKDGDGEKKDGEKPPAKPKTPASDGLAGGGVLSREQVAGLIEIKAGDVYSLDKIRKSTDTVKNAYAKMGYVDAQVAKAEKRDPNQPLVDLVVNVREGRAYRAGLISVKGNDLTQKKVILRELDIAPDRPLDTTTERVGERQVGASQRRVEETRLFAPGSVRVTTQKEDPENPGYRDVLIEVQETNTGSLQFGAGVSSDLGVIGQISLTQRNFDIADTPDSFGELFSGKAFRGAGQEFNITVAPGTETQTYSIGLSDPSILDTDYSAGGTAYYRTREFDEYDEKRIGVRGSLGRKFGERWTGQLTFRYEGINVGNIDPSGAVDLFDVEGDSSIGSLGVQLTRNTTDSRFRPSRGTRLQVGVERAGALGGDYSYTKLSGEHVLFLPVYESFLGYKTVFSLRNEIGYVPEGQGEVPLFERFYRGGSSMRGYRFRTVSPKGIRNDTGTVGTDPVGGTFMFFAGAEINQPVYKDVVSVVGFVDSGTVDTDVSFENYRVSVGLGLRLNIEALGPVPIAFDFGFPVLKVKGDRERVFSFSIDLPF
ncbi:MAG: BamA/TamA family outer membrane protein [Phycisphaerales bacterium]|nr:BamA/TamA family outer membrane protein [Phycisphaerales bacterium]